MATMTLEAAWIDRTGGFLLVAWQMTAGNWLGVPVQSGTVPTIAVNGSAGPVLTNHGVAKRGPTRWIARYQLASVVAAGATVTFTALSGSVADGSITTTPSATTAAVTNNADGSSVPTNVFIDFSEPVGGVGTQAAPFASLNEAKIYAASNTTWWVCGGQQHEWDGTNGFSVTGLTNFHLLQWIGQEPFDLTGACPISGYTTNTGSAWSVEGVADTPALLGYGVDVLFVTKTLQTRNEAGTLTDVVDPRTGATITRSHPSHGMEQAIGANTAARIAAVQASTSLPSERGTWFHDSSNNRLWVHSTQGDASPASDANPYWIHVRSSAGGNHSNGITFIACTGCSVRGESSARRSRLSHWMELSTAYAFMGQSCEACVIENVNADCTGRHGVGFAATKSVNNTIANCCVATFGFSQYDGGVGFFGSSTEVSGNRAIDVETHAMILLRHDSDASNLNPIRNVPAGTAYSNPPGSFGLFSHSAGDPVFIAKGGVRFIRPRCFAWHDKLNTANACAYFTGQSQAPSDHEDPNEYGIVITDPFFAGAMFGAISDAGTMSVDRFFFNFDLGSTNGTATTDACFRALDAEALFRSGVAGCYGEAGTVASAIFRSQNTNGADRARITVLNVSAHQRAADASVFDVRRDGTGTDVYGRLTAKRCVFRMADDGSSTSRLISGTTVSVAGGIRSRLSFEGNLYDTRIPTNNFGFPDSAINTKAEFSAALPNGVDPTGTYDVNFSAAFDNEFSMRPTVGGAVHAARVTSRVPYRGVDGTRGRRPGAWQMGVRGQRGRSRGRGRRSSGSVTQ